MKLLTTLLATFAFLGFAGFASAECQWGDHVTPEETAESPIVYPPKAGA